MTGKVHIILISALSWDTLKWCVSEWYLASCFPPVVAVVFAVIAVVIHLTVDAIC